MTRNELFHCIKELPAETPMCRELELALGVGSGIGHAWYRSQKEHWIGWLNSYDSPGPYGRHGASANTSAQIIFNRLMCPPMVLWLPEAAGLPKPALIAAYNAALSAPPHYASQCAAIRREIPWEVVEFALSSSSKPSCNWLHSTTEGKN